MQAVIASVLVLALGALTQDPAPRPADTSGRTWILQIEGDARALAVVGVTEKNFAYRAPRGRKSPYRVTLLGEDGAVLRTVLLDLSSFCMDPKHRGQSAHVTGDVVVEHAVSLTIKVPALAAATRLEITKVAEARDGADPREPTVLGAITRTDLIALARDRQKDKGRRGKSGAKEGK